MAEVLFVAADRDVHESKDKWRKGDPVVVMPDGHGWGKKEGPPLFVRVRIRGTVEEVEAMLLEPAETGRRKWVLEGSRVDEAARENGRGRVPEHASLNRLAAQLRRRD